ncbi:MAG: xanthine dehydrogenase accessory protein XdhC [Pseudomonadota bacterium]
MTAWVGELARLRAAGTPAVLVTVASVRGSAPREAGAKMIVTAGETSGTIGGGQLEYRCTAQACKWLRDGGTAVPRVRLARFVLGPDCGQCCGGVAEVLFEEIGAAAAGWVGELAARVAADTPVVTVTAIDDGGDKRIVAAGDGAGSGRDDAAPLELARAELARGAAGEVVLTGAAGRRWLIEPVRGCGWHIVVFGAGHVGLACTAVLATLDTRLTLIDSRADALPRNPPANVDTVHAANPPGCVAACPPGADYLVMTHDHALDLALCAEILKRDDAGYCGLIGSRTKRRRFEKRLRALGFDDAALGRLTCPIGIDAVAGKKPAEIAIAVAAEMLALKERRAAAAPGGRRLSAVGSR